MKPSIVAIALAAALAACAEQPSSAPGAPALTRVETIDGPYRGTATRFQARSRACPRPGLVGIHVWDRKFQYKWTREIQIDAEILPDGTIHGETFGVSLSGRLDGDKIEGDVTNGDCGLHFTLTKRES